LAETHWIHDPKTSQGSRHLKLVESVGFVFIKVPERAFELFKLRWREVGHIAGYYLKSGEANLKKGMTRVQTWLSRNAIFFEMFWTTSSNSNWRSWQLNTV
jgi:hypothetical protein